jgi:signal transduction histidine kinase
MEKQNRQTPPVILLVDDTRATIEILAETLADEYDIAVATNGEDALEIAAASIPDLILLDVVMPGLDGYEVCRRLKGNENTRDIPVIFVTTRAETADETHGFELGAVDYITKPISPPVVRARVKTHLALRWARLALEKQNRELLEAARLRDDIDNIMRHDLKGPLTSIIGWPYLIMKDVPLEPMYVRALKSIEESGYMMLNMINRSLDLFKMERGIYNYIPQPVDLVKTLVKVVADQETSARSKELNLVILVEGRPAVDATSFMVKADELLVFSLFSNLVKNAVEASPQHGSIQVSLDRDTDQGLITVANQGEVPEDIRDRFFDKYITRGRHGGTGLGTYSARLMAETMKGSIGLESSPAEGTKIKVSLPLHEPGASGSHNPE